MDHETVIRLIEAAKLIGIEKTASLHDIRTLYHEQLKKWHPDTSDKSPEESHQGTILLNEAYTLLVAYCMNYQFSFREEDLKQHIEKNTTELWMERFGNDPIWN